MYCYFKALAILCCVHGIVLMLREAVVSLPGDKNSFGNNHYFSPDFNCNY